MVAENPFEDQRVTQSKLMENAKYRLNDHRLVRTRSGDLFLPDNALRDHEISRAWLAKELASTYGGTTVVVTHHAPHPLSVHPRYAGDPINVAFTSDLTESICRRQISGYMVTHTTP